MTVRPGTVYLVGAGPGDPGLITARGLELLRRADVVMHDRLVDAALVAEAPALAEVIDVGKGSIGETERQREIDVALVRHARAGRVVVRLKGGDPYVYGRGWEEREACRLAGVPCEVVPGISSAIAAPAAADIPLTLRGVASSVTIVAAPVAGESQLEALARADTGVVLMGVGGLEELAQRVIALGRSPSTPAAIIERATLPGQLTVRSTLGCIARDAISAGCSAPAVVVIGETVSIADGAANAAAVITSHAGVPGTDAAAVSGAAAAAISGAAFLAPSAGALAGRRVLITRPLAASHELARGLRLLGAEVIAAPLIAIELREPDDRRLLERVVRADVVAFTSRHAVRGFRRALERAGGDARRLGHVRLAVVGPVTGRELRTWGLVPDLEPSVARAEALAELLLAQAPRPRHVLFPCGTLALNELPAALAESDVAVDRLIVYETRLLELDSRSRERIESGGDVDAVLLASPSAATALGRSGVNLGNATVVCIGPTTAAAATTFGWNHIRVASVHSDEGMLAVTLRALENKRYTT